MDQLLYWLLKDLGLGSDAMTMGVFIDEVVSPSLDAHAAELTSNLLLLSLWSMMSISASDDKLSASESDPTLSTLHSRDLDGSVLLPVSRILDCGLLILRYQRELS